VHGHQDVMSHRVTAADCATQTHAPGRHIDTCPLLCIVVLMSVDSGVALFHSRLLAGHVSASMVPGRGSLKVDMQNQPLIRHQVMQSADQLAGMSARGNTDL